MALSSISDRLHWAKWEGPPGEQGAGRALGIPCVGDGSPGTSSSLGEEESTWGSEWPAQPALLQATLEEGCCSLSPRWL